MAKDIERRVNDLEARLSRTITDLNRVNQKTHDEVVKLQTRLDRVVSDLNSVNQKTHDYVMKLERNFHKLESQTHKVEKLADPKVQERSLKEIVDRALASYDRKRK